MNLLNRTVLCTAASLAAVQGMAQQPFDLDPSFRTPINSVYINSVAPLPDGDLLLSGSFKFPNDQFDRLLGRVHSDGTPVAGFPYGYGGGKLTEWNGRYYVAVGQLVRRVWPDGTTDEDYIEMNSTPYFSSLQGGDYHVYPDGRILISGLHRLNDPVRGYVGWYSLIWFSDQGYLDTTGAHHRMCDGVIYDFEELPDGKFICTGLLTEYEGNPTSRVFRVEADGAFDPTFNAPIDNTWGGAYAFLPTDQNKVLAGGFFRRPGETDTLCLLRFLPDGGIDPSFNDLQLRCHLYPDAIPYIREIRRLDASRYLIGGRFDEVDGQVRGGIAMIDTAGHLLDDYFTGSGCGAYEWMGDLNQEVFRITSAPDGSYYISGSYHGYDDGHGTPGTNQRMVSRLYGLSVGVHGPDAQASGSLQLYPNPASAFVTLDYDLHDVPRQAAVVVRDITGREVDRLSIATRQGQVTYDVHQLTRGTYTAEVTNGGVRIRTEKLVVRP